MKLSVLMLGLFALSGVMTARAAGPMENAVPPESLRVAEPSWRMARQHASGAQQGEVAYLDVTLVTPGSLAEMAGESIYGIDSLVVRGEVNAVDISTMWAASFYGNLKVINMENAAIESNCIPDNAFYNFDEQFDWSSMALYVTLLERIILPETVEEIGSNAFCYCINLRDANIPSGLQRIGEMAFCECLQLSVEELVVPEGVEEIPMCAFLNCRSLTCGVTLPSTLKSIGGLAFYSSKITSINFPEGLESLGELAFYGCRLDEAVLPSTCLDIQGYENFGLNYHMKRLVLPDGLMYIPNSFAASCTSLTEVVMPSALNEIGPRAFAGCSVLADIELPEGLIKIGKEAFHSCSALGSLTLPSTLQTICAGALMCGLTEIRSANPVPPTCEPVADEPALTPFGAYGEVSGTTVYVPVGSAELYRNAWGWNYFTNFHETDDFGSSGISGVASDIIRDASDLYDLTGRRVAQPVEGRVYVTKGSKIVWHL